MVDIYFDPDYGKLYEDIEGGESINYIFKHELGEVHHMFIKREIPYIVDDNMYYDIVTPYGYGGPIIREVYNNQEKELIKAFEEKFKEYCKENNIVSEFVRFHPIIGNHKSFSSIYHTTYLRRTVATSLIQNKDFFMTEFSKSTRKTIRRALKNGVTYKVIQSPNDISEFINIYYSTMDRNNANKYYYFDEDYFKRCMENFKENILLIQVFFEEKVISMGFYFVYKNIIHAHLSGTLSEYINLSPAYVIKYATAEWASKNNINLIHYGGGTTNSPDDSLYKFKRRFTKDTEFDFYIGKKIWDEEIYYKLCKVQNVDEDIDFFPAYRYNPNK